MDPLDMNLDPDPDLALFFNGTGTPGILLALKYGGEFVSEKGKNSRSGSSKWWGSW